MLDTQIKQQLEQYLALMEGDITIKVSAGNNTEMTELVNELASMSNKIHVEQAVTHT